MQKLKICENYLEKLELLEFLSDPLFLQFFDKNRHWLINFAFYWNFYYPPSSPSSYSVFILFLIPLPSFLPSFLLPPSSSLPFLFLSFPLLSSFLPSSSLSFPLLSSFLPSSLPLPFSRFPQSYSFLAYIPSIPLSLLFSFSLGAAHCTSLFSFLFLLLLSLPFMNELPIDWLKGNICKNN